MPEEKRWHTRAALTRRKRADSTRPTHPDCTNEVSDRMLDHPIP
jgi:hypothetical protein